MTVTIKRACQPCSHNELLTLQQKVGAPIPLDFATFLSKHNGAFPDVNLFRASNGIGGTVTEFLSTDRMLATKRLMFDRFPEDLWPIAQTESGNFVLMRFRHPVSVLFWDHETEYIVVLADSFDEFFVSMQPYETNAVLLRPEQVLEAWIDPDLLRFISNK